jgi:hypothetical protein
VFKARYQFAPVALTLLPIWSVVGWSYAYAFHAIWLTHAAHERDRVIARDLTASWSEVRGWQGAFFALTVLTPRHVLKTSPPMRPLASEECRGPITFAMVCSDRVDLMVL